MNIYERKYIIPLDTLYDIYKAGFTHGADEGHAPAHGTKDAFERLIEDHSPLENGKIYDIKNHMEFKSSEIISHKDGPSPNAPEPAI